MATIELPDGWLDSPKFYQPSQYHPILIAKTPINDKACSKMNISAQQKFSPHELYTSVNLGLGPSQSVGLVIDMTGGVYYGQMDFNQQELHNNVKRIVPKAEDIWSRAKCEHETNNILTEMEEFVYEPSNKNKYIVIHDDNGYNLAAYIWCAWIIHYSYCTVDTAVAMFKDRRLFGIYNTILVTRLYELYSDGETLNKFLLHVKNNPLTQPPWKSELKLQNNNTKKRSLSEINEKKENNNETADKMKKSPPKKRKTKDSVNSVTRTHPFVINIVSTESDTIKMKILNLFNTIVIDNKNNSNNSNDNVDVLKTLKCVLTNPISLSRQSATTLNQQSYYLSFTSVGENMWVFVSDGYAYLIDPKQYSNHRQGLYSIHKTQFYDEEKNEKLDDTLFCGELLVDTHGKSRFVISDILFCAGNSLYNMSHKNRVKIAKENVCDNYIWSLKDSKMRFRVKGLYKNSNEMINKVSKMMQTEFPFKCKGMCLYANEPPFGKRLFLLKD